MRIKPKYRVPRGAKLTSDVARFFESLIFACGVILYGWMIDTSNDFLADEWGWTLFWALLTANVVWFFTSPECQAPRLRKQRLRNLRERRERQLEARARRVEQ